MFCCDAYMQQMSATFPVLLEAEICLEGDVADGKADPSACHQLGQVSVLQYFQGTAGSVDHQHVFRLARLFEKLSPQWLHCSGKQGRVVSGRRSGKSLPKRLVIPHSVVFGNDDCVSVQILATGCKNFVCNFKW